MSKGVLAALIAVVVVAGLFVLAGVLLDASFFGVPAIIAAVAFGSAMLGLMAVLLTLVSTVRELTTTVQRVTDEKGRTLSCPGAIITGYAYYKLGRMATQVGAHYLERENGGRGVLLGGVPGVLPGRVVVLGGGVAGVNAARMATGLGADVTILEVDLERMRFLDITLHTAHTLYSNEAHLMELLPSVDLLIGAVLLPGAKAPKLIQREMLRRMRPGSVVVDIAIDQGGCAETSHPTTHHEPVFVEEGVIHYCVANMPAAYARTATQALTNVTHRYIELLADHGLAEACQRQPALLGGINVLNGKLTCKAVAEAHGMTFVQPAP